MWVDLLQPDLALNDSILALTPGLLQQHRLRGLILDVDETLVPFQQAQPLQEVCQWIEQMRSLFSLVLVSNNVSRRRIGGIARSFDVPFYTGAGKPSRRTLRQAAASMELPHHEIAMVGDRLFTDVLGGNRLGLFTVLVEPLGSPETTLKPRLCLRNSEIWISQRLGVVLGHSPGENNATK